VAFAASLQMNQVTHILNAIDQGDRKAAEELLPLGLLYDQRRRLFWAGDTNN